MKQLEVDSLEYKALFGSAFLMLLFAFMYFSLSVCFPTYKEPWEIFGYIVIWYFIMTLGCLNYKPGYKIVVFYNPVCSVGNFYAIYLFFTVGGDLQWYFIIPLIFGLLINVLFSVVSVIDLLILLRLVKSDKIKETNKLTSWFKNYSYLKEELFL